MWYNNFLWCSSCVYIARCGGVLDAQYNGTVYSPGYLVSGYPPDIQCTWLIQVSNIADRARSFTTRNILKPRLMMLIYENLNLILVHVSHHIFLSHVS